MALNDQELSVDLLTGGEKEGAGIFEELMRTVKSHLSEEYSSGRITADNYTNAYIQSLGESLNVGANYLLQHKVANQQIKLLEYQAQTEQKNTALMQAQIDKLVADTALVQARILQTNAQTDLVNSQKALTDKDVEVRTAQIADIAKDGLVKDSTISLNTKRSQLTDAQITDLGKDGEVKDSRILTDAKQREQLDEQIANLTKDLAVKDGRISLDAANKLLVDAQAENEITRKDQIVAQTAKLTTEKALIEQRQATEQAQTSDTIGGAAVGGVLGKQMTLYGRQADGYLRDAEQKAAKIMLDSFISRVSTDWDNPSSSGAGVGDADCAAVMNKLKSGV